MSSMASGISFDLLPPTPTDKFVAVPPADRGQSDFAAHLNSPSGAPASSQADRPVNEEASASPPENAEEQHASANASPADVREDPAGDEERRKNSGSAKTEESTVVPFVAPLPAGQKLANQATEANHDSNEGTKKAPEQDAASFSPIEPDRPNKTHGKKSPSTSNAPAVSKLPDGQLASESITPVAQEFSLDASHNGEDASPAVAKSEASNLATEPSVAENQLVAEGSDPTTSAESRNSPEAQREVAGDSMRLATADRVRLVQRVARAIEAARPDGEIRLRLRPPELGSVHLRVKMDDGALAAQIETETSHARTLLIEHLPELRERLGELQIRLERFDVEWRGGSDSQGNTSSGQQGDGDGGQRYRPSALTHNRHVSQRASLSPSPAVGPQGGELNVLI